MTRPWTRHMTTSELEISYAGLILVPTGNVRDGMIDAVREELDSRGIIGREMAGLWSNLERVPRLPLLRIADEDEE